MPLILAIEPDRRQAAQLTAVVRKRVSAELILVDTTEQALDALGNRMPDLVLVPALLSPKDDAALAGALRVIAATARVQMLTIPVLGAARPAPRSGGMLSALRRGKSRVVESDGCDPGVFADQIASYLERAAEERASDGAVDATRKDSESWTEAATPPEAAEVAVVADFVESVQEIDDVAVEPLTAMVEDVRVGVEKSIDTEWVDAPAEVAEAPMAVATDESSVSIALEEAVRALFADQAPAAEQRAEQPVEEPAEQPVEQRFQQAVEQAVEPPVPTTAAASAPMVTEWTVVEELMAALHANPLATLEVFAYDERQPVVKDRQSSVDQPQSVIEDPDGDDLGVTAEVKEADGQPVPVAARSEREWVALIESLRQDVERLRVERAEKPVQKSPPPQPRSTKTGKKQKPAQDEWGFFDPDQCGFAALLAKLDEVTEAEEGRV